MTTIRYFIPEDGDTETHPNVFLAPKPARPGLPPKLGDIKGAFPLPGRYHFRFKSPLIPGGDREKTSLAVWMDCTDDNETVGVWRNTIVAKVTRIGIEDDDDDDDEEFEHHHHHATVSAPAPPAPPQAPAPQPGPDMDIFGDTAPSAPSSTPSSMPGSTHSSTGDLLGGDEPPPPPAPAAKKGDAENLLHLSFSPGHAQSAAAAVAASASSAHSDFMGMTSPAPPTASAQQQAPPPSPPQQQHPPQGGYRPQAPHSGGAPHLHQQQQQRQQAPRSGGTPHMQQRAPPGRTTSGGNAFDNFGKKQNPGPFGDLNWS